MVPTDVSRALAWIRSSAAPNARPPVHLLGAWVVGLSFTAPLTAQVPQIITQVQHAERDLTIFANGIPVAEANGDASSHMFQIGPFLVDGQNTIRFEWTKRQDDAMAFSAVVQENRPPDGLTEIARIDDITDDPVREVTVRELTVHVAMPRSWVWEGSRSVSLAPADRSAIAAKVHALHATFAEGDADRVIAMTEMMWREMTGFRAGMIERIRRQYTDRMASPDWSIEPLDATALRIEAFGPLVRVVGDRPLIQQTPTPARNGTIRVKGLFFARVDGEWIPIRPVS